MLQYISLVCHWKFYNRKEEICIACIAFKCCNTYLLFSIENSIISNKRYPLKMSTRIHPFWKKIPSRIHLPLKLIISNSTLIIRTPSHCHKFPQALSHFVGSSPSWGDLIFWNLILNGLFHIFLYIRKSFNKPQMSRQLQNS